MACKQQCVLKEFRTHSKASSVEPTMVEIEHERIHKLIQKYGYQLKDIFNMDETGLFYAYDLPCTHALNLLDSLVFY